MTDYTTNSPPTHNIPRAYNFNVYFGFYCRQTNNFYNDNNIRKKTGCFLYLLDYISTLTYTHTHIYSHKFLENLLKFFLKFLRIRILGISASADVTSLAIIIIIIIIRIIPIIRIVYYFLNVIIVFFYSSHCFLCCVWYFLYYYY